MATGKSLEIYILLQDEATITNSTSVGKKASKFSLGPKKKDKHKSKSTQYVPAGTLLRKDLLTDGQEVYIPLSGSKLEDCHLRYASSVVAKLMSNEEYDLLALISSRTKRIEVYKDKAWMEEGLNLKPKDGVEIHGYSTIQDGTHGIVKSKRCGAGHPGIVFDIQLNMAPKKIISVTIENIRKCQTHSPTGTHHSPKPQGANLAGGVGYAFIDELKKSIKPGHSGKMGMKSRSRSVENILDDELPKPSSTLKRNLQAAEKKHAAARGQESPTNYPSLGKLASQTGKPLNRTPVDTKSPKCTGGMGKKSLSKSMGNLMDDIQKSSKFESPSNRNPPELQSFPLKKSPPQSSGSHSSSGHTWRRASGPEEDDDRKYHAPSPTNIPGTTSNTPTLERFKVERIDGDDEDDMPGSVDNDPADEGICIHDDHYSNDVPGQVRETVEEETEPGYVNVPRPGRDQRRAAENEAIYANLPLPIEVTNGHAIPLSEDQQEESRAADDQLENAGAAASTVDNEDTYGLFSPQGFFTDHNEVFAPCEQRLQEQDHPYEGIEFTVDPDDIFDQTYRLDPNQQYTGTCVIIDQFTHDRKGSFTDVRSIYELFEQKFKFRMDYQKNLSKKEFLDVFKKHRDYMANPATRVQRFICFILGHGDEKGIMTCVGGFGSRFHIEEGARIDINKDLLPFLSSSSLKTMAGKPKLMFIQACRGRAFQGGQGVQGEADPHDGIDQGSSDETTPRPHVSIPDDSDILVAYAQTAGNQAFRDQRAGSWFIQAVSDIFRDYHERYDVLSMMTMVSNAVSYMSRYNPDGSEHKQSPTVQHTLRKKMFMLKASA